MNRGFINVKRFRFIKNIIRLYCNESGKPFVKIDGKCYAPVPCPTSQNSDQPPESPKFIRIVRGDPGKVQLGFLPDEWFKFFHQKTGVTGPYVFLVSVSSYLISKEIYVMEHEYYSMLSIILTLYLVTTRIGSQFAKSIDKGLDEYERQWNANRDGEKKYLEDSIALENKLQKSMDGQLMLQDAKKENVALQLEKAYRERILIAYKNVKKLLDFQVAKSLIEKKFLHRNLIQWTVEQVMKAYTPEKEKETIDSCLEHLSGLAAKYQSSA